MEQQHYLEAETSPMSHREQCVGLSDEWYTPAYIFEAMECRFDLDVAAPSGGLPWIPADHFISENSLETDWNHIVSVSRPYCWCNPPFGPRNGLVPWLEKFTQHGNGVVLVPDRTSAPWWQQYAMLADLILFVSPKIKFIRGDGGSSGVPAQGTTLFAIGPRGRDALMAASQNGLGILLNRHTASSDG